MFLDGYIRRLLIIAPTSVCAVWPAEFQRFGDFPARVGLLLGDHAARLRTLKYLSGPAPTNSPEPLRVAVINYESAWRLKSPDGKRDYLQEFAADMVVCDESQRIKSPSAKQSKAVWQLGALARYRLILSGTPIQKDTRDIWSQWHFLAPEVFPISYHAFQNRYAIMGGFEGKQYLGSRNIEELTRKTHACGFRIRKEECLDLPPKIFEDYPVRLDEKSMRLYRQIQKQAVAELEGSEITANHVLVRMLRLQQLTGGFLVDDRGEKHQVNTAKLDALDDIIESLVMDEGKKLIVFSRFLAEMDAIEERLAARLSKARMTSVRIDGSVKASERGGIVQQFQTDPRCMVFLGELDACAEGLTLTAAQTVVYYSVNWNLAKYQQSADRVHRIGQTGTCTYIHLICPRTIDTKIMDALKSKSDLAKSVVDNWRSIIDEEEEPRHE
ncbi:MAG: DEAD/DEAH box helicase [Clostridia bacterium]|nr:DEAD/DEAH box helicase [Clostridia bacterium]MBR7189067.1 DEAD/DEAH box helicase [Clostridia bacterium]